MKAIHRIVVGTDLVNLVDVLVPPGEVTGLYLEDGGGVLFLHYISDAPLAATVTRQILFAEASSGFPTSSLVSALLDSTDMTGATYLGYARGFHAWLLP